MLMRKFCDSGPEQARAWQRRAAEVGRADSLLLL